MMPAGWPSSVAREPSGWKLPVNGALPVVIAAGVFFVERRRTEFRLLASEGERWPKMAARVAGVHRIFKMGGAHAIAALAYGTASVPRVDKIVGPGNAYVQTAKLLVFGEVGIDSEAGATEVAVVADRTATPAWVAADLISQAEHEEAACSVLFTSVKSIATRVRDQIVLANQLLRDEA